jgi:hypothetical protein
VNQDSEAAEVEGLKDHVAKRSQHETKRATTRECLRGTVDEGLASYAQSELR